ncbi:5-formyltetrahydrofolate cyclo-ligase [Zhihengliuella sp.]|uniref:5-formyltetrahydrofolate cyclo-ligase n=1 Tax=Zhihengliuella sp. TaxID=1954483 RepID=UPI0028123251|nr:5-formyltetrahydrofolate cyclo-ligase [Zhihengliuella sp.]
MSHPTSSYASGLHAEALERKAALRRDLRARRRALEPHVREREMAAVIGHLRALATAAGERPRVAAYLPVGAEPDVRPYLAEVARAGGSVVVPVCLPEWRLAWTEWTPETELVRSERAWVDEPEGERHGPEAVAAADLLLVPAQAIDTAGGRLGQGGGYYDRFLEQLRADGGGPEVLAVVYEHELLPAGEFPTESTDQPVDGVVTASGVRRFGL